MGRNPPAAGNPDLTIAALERQSSELRAELARLREELVGVQEACSAATATRLREVNERLVLSALRARTIAETAEAHLGHATRAAQHDALTGTPNRLLMLDRLHGAIAAARRHGRRVGVLFLDLDDFKQINDTLGHAAGDLVLQQVARCLESSVRETDTVSRHGGDEFLVLMADLVEADDAGQVARKILAALAVPNIVGGHTLGLSASIGISIFPEDGEEPAILVRHADAAMFRSKRTGHGRFAYYGTRGPREDVEVAMGTPLVAPGAQASGASRLQEANEHLVIAALSAREQEELAVEAHRRQIHFMATVAHELRNPLAPIRMAADLLASGRDELPYERLQGIIKTQVTHLSRLIDDLLDGSRLSTGKLRLDRSSVDLVAILERCAAACLPSVTARRQRLDVRLPSGPFAIHGDAVRLAQVFTNLLENASKYTPEDGAVSLMLVATPTHVQITVSDNGIGIDAAVVPRIFDLFVQDPRAMTFARGGLGIGLALVRDLVGAHGGTITVASNGPDRGSSFTVTLPSQGAGT
jgi:diguanylate cyclase (GGDEF)-like protein